MNTRPIVLTFKVLLVTFGLLALLLIAAYNSLPTLLILQLPSLIEQNTGRKASIGQITIQASPFTLNIKDFVIQEKNTHPFVAFDILTIQLDFIRSLKESQLIVNQINLAKPIVHLFRQANGAFNFEDLTAPKNEDKTVNHSILPINIAKLLVTEGKLVWSDDQAPNPWSETIEPIKLSVDNLSIQNDQPAYINLNLDFQSGGSLAWTGKFNLAKLTSQGHLDLENVNLNKFLAMFVSDSGINISQSNNFNADYQAKYADNKFTLQLPKTTVEWHDLHYKKTEKSLVLNNLKYETALIINYSPESFDLEAKNAKIQVNDLKFEQQLQGNLKQLLLETHYQLSLSNNQMNLTVNQGSLSVKELRIIDQSKVLAYFPELAATGLQSDLKKHSLKASFVNIKNANLNAWLNADGTINYQSLIPAEKSSSSPTVSPENWQIDIEGIALEDCALTFEDRTFAKPTIMKLKPINFKLRGYSNGPAQRLPFEFSMGVNNNGLISLKGDAILTPFMAKLDMKVSNIDLEKFQPYYDRIIHLDIIDGLLDIDGQLSLQQPSNQPLAIQFSGNGGINDMLIRDQRVHKDFLKWEKLTLKDLNADVLSHRYTAGELTIQKPYARITIRKDKTVNFSNLVITNENKVAPASQLLKTKEPTPFFKLGKIKVIDGSSDFTDLSLVLPFSAHVKSLGGEASGASSEKKSQINVDLKGNAYDLAPVEIIGKISPYLGEYDAKMNFNGLPMPLVSSYMVQFAGYKVEKGKMTLNLHYQIADKKLSASNHFLIDQFELGERVENPDAVSLPIKLAVALLKDSNGKIKIDVPITGNLDSPQFNIGTIVTEALINALSKIVSSPFSALASLVGNHEESLSKISFKAGSATLDTLEQEKLTEIAKALTARPDLSLEIKGTTIQEQDWPAISDDALYDQLKIRRAAEINKNSQQKIRAEYVELTNNDYQRLLAEMFIEKFPLLAEKSLLGIPQLINSKDGKFYQLAKAKLQDIINPEQERLKELANDRSQAIAKYLVQQGHIAQERVYILDSVVKPDKAVQDISSLLSLKVN